MVNSATPTGNGLFLKSIDDLLRRFFLVYELPEVVFDAQERKIIPLKSLRNAAGHRELYRAWMAHPDRRMVRERQVGFDPSEQDEQIICNLWGGWPTKPAPGNCQRLLDLLKHLCSREVHGEQVYAWVLRWLAYPIQNPGAKLKTALVFHGPQGSGKNMFFEAVQAIYGQYGRVIDQAAVEDKFNDWASKKLFLIADEVVARHELRQVKNKLKGLITGSEIRINRKSLPAIQERNCLNFVFLSNEVMPAVLERDDRRHLVVWTPPKLDAAFYEAVKLELDNGGAAALHAHLLNLPLDDFKPWTLPPMTAAKEDLLELGTGPAERFLRDWQAGYLPLPVVACRTEDLYLAAKVWSHRTGSRLPPIAMFIAEAVKRAGARRERRRHFSGSGQAAQSMVFIPNDAPLDLSVKDLSDQLRRFEDALTRWSIDVGRA